MPKPTRPANSSMARWRWWTATCRWLPWRRTTSLVEKLKSNLQEVRARGGELVVFADEGAGIEAGEGTHVVGMPHIGDVLSPILYTIPLQLLSYHVAVLKGTDVDQPRNLAKSVTVE